MQTIPNSFRSLALKVMFPNKKITIKRSLQMDYGALFNTPKK